MLCNRCVVQRRWLSQDLDIGSLRASRAVDPERPPRAQSTIRRKDSLHRSSKISKAIPVNTVKHTGPDSLLDTPPLARIEPPAIYRAASACMSVGISFTLGMQWASSDVGTVDWFSNRR